MYGNDELHIPKAVKNAFKACVIDEDTIFEWDVQGDVIILKPRRKVTLDDVSGMVKKVDDNGDDWDIDGGVYLE